MSDKTSSFRAVFSSYNYWIHSHYFYKITYNTVLVFNLIITEFFDFFYAEILVFLFAMIYYDKSEY